MNQRCSKVRPDLDVDSLPHKHPNGHVSAPPSRRQSIAADATNAPNRVSVGSNTSTSTLRDGFLAKALQAASIPPSQVSNVSFLQPSMGVRTSPPKPEISPLDALTAVADENPHSMAFLAGTPGSSSIAFNESAVPSSKMALIEPVSTGNVIYSRFDPLPMTQAPPLATFEHTSSERSTSAYQTPTFASIVPEPEQGQDASLPLIVVRQDGIGYMTGKSVVVARAGALSTIAEDEMQSLDTTGAWTVKVF